MKIKKLFLDTETTGTTPNSAIVQIAGVMEVGGVIREFDINMRPHEGADISEKALEIIGKSLEEINSYQSPEVAAKEFEKILKEFVDPFDKNDKFVLYGHNIQFDFTKLMEWYNRIGNKYLGSFIDFKFNFDTLQMIKNLQLLEVIDFLENNKLETCCEAFGIKLEGAHDALNDIKATKKLYEHLEYIIKSKFDETYNKTLYPRMFERWSTEEEEFLKVTKDSAQNVADRLGRTPQAVLRKAKRMNIYIKLK
ncbi:3'-5' exonuclease [Cetobacterium sp.]|uniref:3'-5' exonuclease n=1 Tax=Cetobacterium sp. TaxID=2071632 RepID=UPI003F2A6CD5